MQSVHLYGVNNQNPYVLCGLNLVVCGLNLVVCGLNGGMKLHNSFNIPESPFLHLYNVTGDHSHFTESFYELEIMSLKCLL